MEPLRFKIIEDEQEAKNLWENFSPHKAIDDEWDFRYTFVKDLNLPFHFIVGYDKEKAIGLLPLQLNTVKGLGPKLLQMHEPFLELFGGVDTDNNRVFILPGFEQYTTDFLKQIKMPAILTDLAEKYALGENEAVHSIDRYELNLENLPSFEAFLQRDFSGKSRGTIVNKINHMHKNNTIEVKTGSVNDLHLLFAFSKERFGKQSSFHMAYRQQIYRELLTRFDVDLFTIQVDGIAKAVAYCIVYNKTYTLLNIGYDHELRDIGKLLVTTQIERAISRGCTKYDAGKGENGWKERFHLTKIPQYKLTLNYLPTLSSPVRESRRDL